MGDTVEAQARKYGVPIPPAPDLEKARAERRGTVARNIDQGLISEAPAARNTDPDTSHAAVEYHQRRGTRASNQQKVLKVVHELPGLTYHEIAKQAELDRHETMKRLGDLKGNPDRNTPPLVRHGEKRLVRLHPDKPAHWCVTWWPTEYRL